MSDYAHDLRSDSSGGGIDQNGNEQCPHDEWCDRCGAADGDRMGTYPFPGALLMPCPAMFEERLVPTVHVAQGETDEVRHFVAHLATMDYIDRMDPEVARRALARVIEAARDLAWRHFLVERRRDLEVTNRG